jgi:hypothetical protein
MTIFLPRAITARIAHALTLFPVVVVTGSRQTGKSTLVREAPQLSARRYVTLDTAVNREVAANEPRTFVNNLAAEATVDEVQRVPELLISIKEQVDANRTNGRYLLTGSANLLLLRSVSESLAGRARYLTLWPMTRREQLGLATCGIWTALFDSPIESWPALIQSQQVPPEPWQTLASRGGYPAPALLNPSRASDADRNEIFTGYAQTYLERDLRDLATVDSLVDFQRLMRAICLRIGNVINQADLSRDTGIPRTTVQRYLNLLEISYQLVRLEPYSVNRSKRLVKSPKIYWSDAGLALHLSAAAPAGAHLENIVCTDLLTWREFDPARPAILFWRTANGEEVDFVIERNGKLLGIEVKATTNPGYNDSKGLRAFLQEYGDDVVGGILLHGGDETFWISERVLAAPWWKVI